METYCIHINGIVQGLGFRPLIYHLASRRGFRGTVENGADGLTVFINSSEQEAAQLFREIKIKAPAGAKITDASLRRSTDQQFGEFSILVRENAKGKGTVSLTTDVATCQACIAELNDPANRRYRYPFITCTSCGPRYSIAEGIPYERHNTTVSDISMCSSCHREYSDISDRRFFSQTNSCPDCGFLLGLLDTDSGTLLTNQSEVFESVRQFLGEGKIVAVKGIGGYLLLCDAGNIDAIRILRSRKQRPAKPLAVLYPNIDMVSESFQLGEQEKTSLKSSEAPIVLLRPKTGIQNELTLESVAPKLNRIGVMIPSNPLFHLISSDFGRPLIATSANVSGSPIIYTEEDATEYLKDIADYILSHDRRICVPQDDSVVAFSKDTNCRVILRRSRGYAPSFLDYRTAPDQCMVATGANMKMTFALVTHDNALVSQFLGSGESYDSQLMYKHTLDHCLDLYSARPSVVITDLHPDYFSHQHAVSLALKFGADFKRVQHHEAHFAAVLAENNLLCAKESILGVIWDGTGLGHDRNIWGGEFFSFENNEMSRCGHLNYFPSVAGDKMSLEPRIAALCVCKGIFPIPDYLRSKFTSSEWDTYQRLIQNSVLRTSSAGRMIDAVASLLNICDKQSYEGEAAMYLQKLAEDHVTDHGFSMKAAYYNVGIPGAHLSVTAFMDGILNDIQRGESGAYIAARFFYSLVCSIGQQANEMGVGQICMSGGVFQNTLLVDWINKKYSHQYQLHYNINLSPNDENISFGQVVHYQYGIRSKQRSSDNESVENSQSRLTHPKFQKQAI